MSHNTSTLQNSFGPEAAPYQAVHQQPLEYYSGGVGDKTFAHGTQPPEVVPPKSWPGPTTSPGPKRKILGMRVGVFWTVLVIIIVVILGVGIGVGVGVGLKGDSDGDKSSSSSPTSSSTSFSQTKTSDTTTQSSTSTGTSTTTATTAVVTSGTHGLAANSCTFTSPRTYQASGDSKFTQYCFTDWPSGVAAADGSGPVKDLKRTTVYTFEDCMNACVTYNKNLPKTSTKCEAITYNSNLTSIIEEGQQGGNCFLKNKKGQDLQGVAESACAALVF